MSEVRQLMDRILGLTPRDFAEFRAWFLEFDARVWDRQIEADVKAGRLDGIVAEALADYGFFTRGYRLTSGNRPIGASLYSNLIRTIPLFISSDSVSSGQSGWEPTIVLPVLPCPKASCGSG